MSDLSERTDSESEEMETSINIHENSDSEETESESSDSDEDAKNIQSFVDCLNKIEQNKYNYDSYVELLVLAQCVFVFFKHFQS